MSTAKHDPRITFTRRPTVVLWTIRPRPEGYGGATNGAEANRAKAVKAAEHALRMLDHWQSAATKREPEAS